MGRAVCKDVTGLMFAHECNPRKCKRRCEGDYVEDAKALCATCPVIAQCWNWLWFETEEAEDGVIAGTTKQERIKLRRSLK